MNYQVEIRVDENGNFSYLPALLRVSPKSCDTVSWACPCGHLTVMFQSTSPFSDAVDACATPGQASEPLRIAENAKGQYKYAVAVYNGTRVFVDSNCPVIIAN